MTYLKGQNYQLIRVDLTSLTQNDLTSNFKRLRRIVEKTYSCKMQYYKIETSEGRGVLHTVWAIKQNSPVWIPQSWLSETWEKLTGAKIVYIRRVSSHKSSTKRIAHYLVTQYLAGQDAIVRVSWSWWRSALCLGKSFRDFYLECKRGFLPSRMCGLSPFVDDMDYKTMMNGWTTLLSTGSWSYGGATFFISGKDIDVGYAY